MLHKNSERLHHDMFCVAKTTSQPPSQPPYSTVGKASGFRSQGRGLDPGSYHLFFRIFLFISKEKVRACFFSARINQPTSCYFWHGEVRKKKKSGPVALRYFTCGKVSLEYRVQRVGCAARLMRCTGDRRQMAHLLRPDHGRLQRVVSHSTTVI